MNVLQDILINTYNPDPGLRKRAEEALGQFLCTPGSCMVTLQLTSDQSVHRDLRQASGILLKNKIRAYWSAENGLSASDEEKLQFRSSIVEALLSETDSSLRRLIVAIITDVCLSDYPGKWSGLMPTLLAQIQTADPLKIFNALSAVRKVIKRYEFKQKEQRGPLDDIVQAAFPLLQQLLPQLIDNNSIEAAKVIHVCVKIFYSATMHMLPKVAGVDVNLWFTAFAQLLQKPLPEEGQPSDPELRRKDPWWQVKKWVARVITHFIQRYGNPRYAGEEHKQYAEYFRAQTAPALLQPAMAALSAKADGGFLTEDVQRMCIMYVANCVEMSPTYKVLKPHLDYLIFQVLFPVLCLTPVELELFDDDPAEFVRKVHDPSQEWMDSRLAAITVMQKLAKYRQKEFLPRLLPFLQKVLMEYGAAAPEQKDYRQKDGILVTIASVASILRESKKYRSQLEVLLRQHIIPEFSSPAPFLRARAFWVLDYFEESDYGGRKNLQGVVQGLLQGMRDPSMPVQAAAALSMRQLVKAEGTDDLLRPILSQLVGEYFRIMAEQESEAVLAPLQAIVDKFGDEIKPLAPMMVENLITAFEGFASGGSDDDENAFSATECLDTIISVLDAMADDAEALVMLEGPVLTLVCKLLSGGDQGFEYLSQALGMLSYFTYSGDDISPNVWALCGPLLHALSDWAYDSMQEIMVPLLNYMTRATPTFIAGHHNGVPFVQTLCLVIERAFLNTDDSSEYTDAKHAASLLMSFISTAKANSPGMIDGIVQQAVGVTCNRLLNTHACRTTAFRVKLLECVMAAIYYNPALTLQALGSLSPTAVEAVFGILFDNLKHMDRESSERLVVVSFSALLSLPPGHLPPVLQKNTQNMLAHSIKEVAKVMERNEENDDSEDDEGDDDDDDEEELSEDEDDENDDGNRRGRGKKGGKDVVPEGGYDSDDDCRVAEDEAYLRFLEETEKAEKAKKARQASRSSAGMDADADDDDEDDDDEEDEDEDDDECTCTLPIDTLDVLMYFMSAMRAASDAEPAYISSLQNALSKDDKVQLQQLTQVAMERSAS